jgi:hypothetical protein
MLGFIGDGVNKISEEVEERRHSDDKHIPEYAAKLSNAVSNRDYAWKMLRILLSETELKNFEEA